MDVWAQKNSEDNFIPHEAVNFASESKNWGQSLALTLIQLAETDLVRAQQELAEARARYRAAQKLKGKS